MNSEEERERGVRRVTLLIRQSSSGAAIICEIKRRG